MQFRNAQAADVDALAAMWHSGWQDAHATILPVELARVRTFDKFRERVIEHLADVRVAGEPGQQLGFAMFKDDELYQFYVSATARGTGLATLLMQDAEATLLARGIHKPWLACAIGNDRAARFYEKSGWQRTGTTVLDLPMPDGSVFKLEVWRYEKALR